MQKTRHLARGSTALQQRHDATAKGATPRAARLTRASVERLGIAPGRKVYALVKAIAIDRRSVGYA